MKIIISESALNTIMEISTKENPKSDIVSRSSNVYFGNNVVKKVSRGRWSMVELTALKIMQQHPKYFAKTKIVNERLVVQEKLNTQRLIAFYRQMQAHLDDNCKEVKMWFDAILNNIVRHGLNHNSTNDAIECLQKTLPENLMKEWKKIFNLCLAVHPIYKENEDNLFHHSPDLHQLNLGYDSNGNIKILDFISPLS